jgi:Xaa-Pro aminopeptidase
VTGSGIPDTAFAHRRARLLAALGDEGVMVLAAAPEIVVGRDLELRYVVDPDLWYLTGYPEPEAVAVLTGASEPRYTLFVRPRDAERETWTGPRGGVEAAMERFGAEAAHPIGELDDRLPGLLRECHRVHFRIGGGRPDVERLVLDIVARARHARQRSGTGLAEIVDPGVLLDEMRLIKEPGEVAAIRDAVAVTMPAFMEGFRMAKPGTGEWVVEAAVEGAMRAAGADGPAFATIAASGPNATILHYTENRRRMEKGDLLLLDAGARHRIYNADITRTIPVGGRFSPPQRDVYTAVLAAQRAAIDAARPGATTADVHLAALRVLIPAMIDLGLLHQDPSDLLEQAAQPAQDPDPPWKRWYPHNSSHWLGLDVHDVGTYGSRGTPRRLEPGMVMTVEPGLYIPPHAEDAPDALRNIGVRIEDDLLVDQDGPVVLSQDLPTDPDALEAFLQNTA